MLDKLDNLSIFHIDSFNNGVVFLLLGENHDLRFFNVFMELFHILLDFFFEQLLCIAILILLLF